MGFLLLANEPFDEPKRDIWFLMFINDLARISLYFGIAFELYGYLGEAVLLDAGPLITAPEAIDGRQDTVPPHQDHNPNSY